MLNRYLEDLTKQASAKGEMTKVARQMSFAELAKMAGIKLADGLCPACGNHMEKQGSVLKCGCGMMKQAAWGPGMQEAIAAGTATGHAEENLKGLKKRLEEGKTRKGSVKDSKALMHKKAQIGEIVERAGEAVRPYLHLADDIPVLAQKAGLFKEENKPALKPKTAAQLPQEELEARLKKVTGNGKTTSDELKLPADKGSLGAKSKELGSKTAGLTGMLLNARANAPVIAKKIIQGAPPAAATSIKKVIKGAPPAALAKAAADKTAKKDMPHFTDQDRPKKVKEIFRALKREHPEYSAGKKARIASAKGKNAAVQTLRLPIVPIDKKLVDRSHEDSEDPMGAEAQKTAMEKAAIMPLLRAGGKLLKSVGKSAIGGDFARAGKTLGAAPKALGKAWGGMDAGQKMTTVGIGAGLGGLAAGHVLTPQQKVVTAAVDQSLLVIGDKAGRLLAKVAARLDNTPISPEELEESIQEAQEREDIPGRSKTWQIGGGIGGGLLGAAPGAAMALLSKRKLLGAGLGALGSGIGAGFGQRAGAQHGAEEAAADKAVSLLRALRAHQAGAQMGFGEGLRQGSAAGGLGKSSDYEDG